MSGAMRCPHVLRHGPICNGSEVGIIGEGILLDVVKNIGSMPSRHSRTQGELSGMESLAMKGRHVGRCRITQLSLYQTCRDQA